MTEATLAATKSLCASFTSTRRNVSSELMVFRDFVAYTSKSFSFKHLIPATSRVFWKEATKMAKELSLAGNLDLILTPTILLSKAVATHESHRSR